MNKKEVEQLIVDVTNLIKEKVSELKYLNTDEYGYMIKEKELEDLKQYLILLKQLQAKFSQMARINETEVKTLIDKVKNYLKGNR